MSTTINDDRIARDIAEEIAEAREATVAIYPRNFPDVINQWTDTLLEENKKSVDPLTVLLVLRLGTLGQRLIYEANDIGMRDAIKIAKDALAK